MRKFIQLVELLLQRLEFVVDAIFYVEDACINGWAVGLDHFELLDTLIEANLTVIY
jgi:hypothetical protein